MTDAPASDFAHEAATHAAAVRSRQSDPARRTQTGGGRALAIMAIGLGIPGAFAAINWGALEAPAVATAGSATPAATPAVRTGLEAAVWTAAATVLGHEIQPASSVASVKLQPVKLPAKLAGNGVGVPCLAMAAADEPLPVSAANAAARDSLQSPPSIDCLPPSQTATPPLQTASADATPGVHKPATPAIALKELPQAVPRPSQVAIAPLPMAPTTAASPAARGLHVRPTALAKGAPLPPPDGMKAPEFVAQAAAVSTPLPVPVARPVPEVQMGVTSAGPAQPIPAPGAHGVTAGAKGKTQTAQIGVGQWGNRPPEMLPWLEPDGSSRRSSLGGTNKGGTQGQIQVFGKTITTGAPKWTEDIYKSRN
jgi:hypothetical protein